MPVSNLIWADRHGAIGYKTDRPPPHSARATAPTCRSPAGPASSSGTGSSPTRSCPSSPTPTRATWSPPTTGSSTTTTRTTSAATTSTATAPTRIEQLIAGDRASTTSTTSRACRPTSTRSPATRSSHRLARLTPAGQRETRAIERLKSWDRELGPDSIAASIYQAFILRLAREFARAAIGDRDLAERYLDRADNGFIAHVTSPWRWHSHLLTLWEEGDDELIGRPWDELALDALRGALDDLEQRFGPDPEAWRWGASTSCASLTRSAPPTRPSTGSSTAPSRSAAAQETVAQVAYDPNDPYAAIWAPSWRMVADPAATRALALAGLHRPVGPRLEPALRRPPAALARGRDPADGRRGPVADA